MPFEQHAEGKATIQTIPGTPHCGLADGTVNLEYCHHIEYADEALDGDGFLLDNTTFLHYWERKSSEPVSYSCENMAKNVCMDILDILGTRANHVVYCYCSISPFAGVRVQYIWRRDD